MEDINRYMETWEANQNESKRKRKLEPQRTKSWIFSIIGPQPKPPFSFLPL